MDKYVVGEHGRQFSVGKPWAPLSDQQVSNAEHILQLSGGGAFHYNESMKKIALILLMLPSLAWAQSYDQGYSLGRPPTDSNAYQPASGQWAHRGGTVVQQVSPQVYVITTNGPMPYRGILSATRGSQVVDGAYVLESGSSIVRIQTWSRNSLRVGDLVMLDSVLRPNPQVNQTFAGSRPGSEGYHPSSTMADSRYRSWLSRGFTLGGFSPGPGSWGFGGGWNNGGCNNW